MIISRVWLWFDPNSILWVLSIHFRRSLVIKSIIIFLQIHLRKRPKDFCRLHIQFPDSSCLILTLMMQTNLILMTVSKTKETNCISSLVSGNPKRFIKNWFGQHLTVSQCLKIAQDVALEQKPGFLSFYGTVGSPINIR